VAKKPKAPPPVEAISKKDAATEKSVTKGAVSLACRPGGILHAALLDDGRLNRLHPNYVAWLRGERQVHGVVPRADRAPTSPPKKTKGAPSKPTGSPKKPEKSAGEPTADSPETSSTASQARVPTDDELSGLLATFGTHRNLSDSLKLRKTYVDLLEKELRLKESKGQLVKREILVTIVTAFDQAFHRLLTDLPKTSSRELYAMARSDRPLEEAETKAKELVSSHLSAAKEQVMRALREAHGPTTGELPRPA
jgi:hypothetical protein